MIMIAAIFYTLFLPVNNYITNRIRNMKNKIFANPAAAPAIPENPKKAAIIAIITKVIVQRNIF